jgi:hypothetical protein
MTAAPLDFPLVPKKSLGTRGAPLQIPEERLNGSVTVPPDNWGEEKVTLDPPGR